MKICYFTATGNSLYVARRIGGGNAELLSIPKLMKEGVLDIEDDAVGIVAPIYDADMPKMVRRFMEQVRIKTDYFFFVYTYGFSETVARPHAELEAEKVGLKLSYANSIKMVDNYLPGFEAQEQIDTIGKKDVEGQIDKVCRDIAARREIPVKVGVGAKVMIPVMRQIGKSVMRDTAAQDYIVTNACVRCGICARVCPAVNIMISDHVEFGNRCEVCYACVHNCPHNAIHLKDEKSSTRFRNENVKLKDIIAANN